MKVHASIEFGQHRLTSTEEGARLDSPGKTTELPGVELSVWGDQVTLKGPEQTLSFHTDGSGATLVDSDESVIRLDRKARFNYGLAGFTAEGGAGAEGTLVAPGREINPLIPLEAFLPQAERAQDPTLRTGAVLRGLTVATSHPVWLGLAVAVGTWIALDFAIGAVAGAATIATAYTVHAPLKSLAHKHEKVTLSGAGALARGELTVGVSRGPMPSPGSSRISSLVVDEADLKLSSGIQLKDTGRRLELKAQNGEWKVRGADLVLDQRNLKVKESGQRLYRIEPNGNLATEEAGHGKPGEFASAFRVLEKTSTSPEDTDLDFKEDEIIIDEFSVPYDH